MVAKVQQAKIILASRSPRRRYLLEQAGLNFEVIPSRFDESLVPQEEPATYVQVLARAKAEDIAPHHPRSWVIGADTIVTIGRDILGKPQDHAIARDMLRRLSGQTHQVLTGWSVCCSSAGVVHTATVVTDVTFKTLSADEIEWYIHTGEPFDKAGAYAIQGLGTFLVRRINGSYTNVVGLPVCEVIEFLIEAKVVHIVGREGESGPT